MTSRERPEESEDEAIGVGCRPEDRVVRRRGGYDPGRRLAAEGIDVCRQRCGHHGGPSGRGESRSYPDGRPSKKTVHLGFLSISMVLVFGIVAGASVELPFTIGNTPSEELLKAQTNSQVVSASAVEVPEPRKPARLDGT